MMRRPRPQFRLSTLLWITLAVAILCSVWLPSWVHAAVIGIAFLAAIAFWSTTKAWGDLLVTMPHPQFRLRSLFILTAIVAVGCWGGRWATERYHEYRIRQAFSNWKTLKKGRHSHWEAEFRRLEQQKLDAQLKASPPTD
jgi:hypothetical protein